MSDPDNDGNKIGPWLDDGQGFRPPTAATEPEDAFAAELERRCAEIDRRLGVPAPAPEQAPARSDCAATMPGFPAAWCSRPEGHSGDHLYVTSTVVGPYRAPASPPVPPETPNCPKCGKKPTVFPYFDPVRYQCYCGHGWVAASPPVPATPDLSTQHQQQQGGSDDDGQSEVHGHGDHGPRVEQGGRVGLPVRPVDPGGSEVPEGHAERLDQDADRQPRGAGAVQARHAVLRRLLGDPEAAVARIERLEGGGVSVEAGILPPDAAAPVPDAALPDAIREALDAYRDALTDPPTGEGAPWMNEHQARACPRCAGDVRARHIFPACARARLESALRDEVERAFAALRVQNDLAIERLNRALDAERALAEERRRLAEAGVALGSAEREASDLRREVAEARAEREDFRQRWQGVIDKAGTVEAERDEARSEVERLRGMFDALAEKKTAAEAREAALNAALFRASEVMRALRKHVTDDTLANLEREIDAAAAALSVPPGARSPGGDHA